MNDQQKLEQFLGEQQFMVLAVALSDGTPWAVPVRIAKQEGREFYWDSALNTEHSKAIAEQNSGVAITIYQKTEDIMFGFYAKGTAELLEEYKPGYGHYKFVASQCWINDETFVKREVDLF